jgi:hypothetical protein
MFIAKDFTKMTNFSDILNSFTKASLVCIFEWELIYWIGPTSAGQAVWRNFRLEIKICKMASSEWRLAQIRQNSSALVSLDSVADEYCPLRTCGGQRAILNFTPGPQGWNLSPWGNDHPFVHPQGWSCPLGVKLSSGGEILCLPLHSFKQ